MSDIKTFPFERDKFDQIKSYHFGKNWPVVYIIENGKEVYIGETINAHSRSIQHFENPDRKRLKRIHILSDPEYNKSATLDLESSLIQYITADGVLKIQNGNTGLQNHNYFDRPRYTAKLQTIWKNLQQMKLVRQDLLQIQNSDVFKYSPYKALTGDQIQVVNDIFSDLQQQEYSTYLISGSAGTGKSVLATYLVKFLKSKKETKNLEVGLVIPMTSLRKTIKRVFRNVAGLSPNMVIGPNDVTKKTYDLLIVDEAHRLKQRKNITNYRSFDATNKKLGLSKDSTELDWILNCSKSQILFYDEKQSVRPADIRPEQLKRLTVREYSLKSQLRVSAGEDYIQFVDELFALKNISSYSFPSYDLKAFTDIREMVAAIKEKDAQHGLARMVAGYAWGWNTKKDPESFDIEIQGYQMKWNSVTQDWVNSPNAIHEVGCIHTVQGYDLNYVGVIIGPELSYDPVAKKLVTDKSKYHDMNGHRGVDDPDELHQYIINIYKTLLTRGIKGAYVYAVDGELQKLLVQKLNQNKD